MSEYTPSTQQQAFYDRLETSRRSVVLEAVAGAGKTETLARAVMQMTGYVTVMMFNKAAAEEFKARLERLGATTRDDKGRINTRPGLMVGTCHSIGLGAWRKFDNNFDVQDKKVDMIIESMCLDEKVPPEIVGMLVEGTQFIKRMVSIAKQMLAGIKFGVDDLEVWLRMAAHFGLDQDLSEEMDVARLTQLAQQVFVKSGKLCKSTTDRKGQLDFDDMIWAPLAYNVKFFTVDDVVLDEAQDTNPARQELAYRCLKRGTGRLSACGDSRQAIYGFTGASADALTLIEKKFDADRMPLTVTYRCPKAVVKHAHQWVNHIEAHESAPEGTVRMAASEKGTKDKPARKWYEIEEFLPTDAILCRYNKPIVSLAFALLKSGVACKVEGRDIGLGLIALTKRFKVKTLDALVTKLEAYRAKEVKKAQAKRSESQEQSVNDRVDCLLVFVEQCQAEGATKVECVTGKIEALFADNVKDVLTLASGHKSKGREWPRVFWIQTEQRGKREMQAHEKVQEDNIKYVITTRAQDTLVLAREEAK